MQPSGRLADYLRNGHREGMAANHDGPRHGHRRPGGPIRGHRPPLSTNPMEWVPTGGTPLILEHDHHVPAGGKKGPGA